MRYVPRVPSLGSPSFRSRVLVFATAMLTVAAVAVGASAPAQAETWTPGQIFSLSDAQGLAVTSDGATAVAGSGDTPYALVIDVETATNELVVIGVKTGPIVMDATDTYAYFISTETAEIVRMKMSDLSLSRVSVSASARFLLMDISGDYLYVQGSAVDRINLSNFTAELGFLSGSVAGPIVQTQAGAIYVYGTSTVQHFSESGTLVWSFSRNYGEVGAAMLSPDGAYIIGVNANGYAVRSLLSVGTTEVWRQGLGYGAGYGDILVRGDYGYSVGVLGQVVTKFSLINPLSTQEMIRYEFAGYPKSLAAPADGSFFLLTLPGVDEVRMFSVPQPPSTPNAPTAVAGDGSVTVTASAASAGSLATSVKVTASPGGANCTIYSAAGECTVSGLQNGTSYTFTVIAANTVGESGPSAASAPVTPQASGTAPSGIGPQLRGVAVEGNTLSAAITSLTGTGTIERVWTWQRKRGATVWVNIPNSDAETYVMTAADIGHFLRARVVLSNEIGETTLVFPGSEIVLSQPAQPAAPRSVKANFKIKTAKSWTITVAWAKVVTPRDDPLIGYTITCKAGKLKLKTSAAGNKTKATLTATKAALYSCAVTVIRERGGKSVASARALVKVK